MDAWWKELSEARQVLALDCRCSKRHGGNNKGQAKHAEASEMDCWYGKEIENQTAVGCLTSECVAYFHEHSGDFISLRQSMSCSHSLRLLAEKPQLLFQCLGSGSSTLRLYYGGLPKEEIGKANAGVMVIALFEWAARSQGLERDNGDA
jgi:hypothetical protein